MKHLIALLSAIPAIAGAGDLPNPTLTPGAVDTSVTQQNIRSTVCLRGYTKSVRPPQNYTNRLKKKQMREYGYIDKDPHHYEEDHLIPLNIGGNPGDPRNLWPQPKLSQWNATKKDELEFRLHTLVCDGEVSLDEARHDMASDWIRAYRKYVH